MTSIPALLTLARALLGPVAVIAAHYHFPSVFFFCILVIGFLSDILDGVIARQLGIATPDLRRADSLADTVFYIGICIAAFMLNPKEMTAYWPGIAVIVLLELVRYGFDYWKFRQEAAYHMWSAKLWGVTLLAGFGEFFLTGKVGVLFEAAVAVGIFTEIEGLLASIVLRRWRHDVPTLYHAILLARQNRFSDIP